MRRPTSHHQEHARTQRNTSDIPMAPTDFAANLGANLEATSRSAGIRRHFLALYQSDSKSVPTSRTRGALRMPISGRWIIRKVPKLSFELPLWRDSPIRFRIRCTEPQYAIPTEKSHHRSFSSRAVRERFNSSMSILCFLVFSLSIFAVLQLTVPTVRPVWAGFNLCLPTMLNAE